MNGFTLSQEQAKDFSGVPGDFVTGQKPYWENGNGLKNEKLDAYGHIAAWSTGEADFNKKAKQPWIASANKGDSAPVSHPLGFTLNQEENLQVDTSALWADYWKIEDLDSKTS